MMTFLAENALYVVLLCALTLWAGIAVYLWRIDTRLSALEMQAQREHHA